MTSSSAGRSSRVLRSVSATAYRFSMAHSGSMSVSFRFEAISNAWFVIFFEVEALLPDFVSGDPLPSGPPGGRGTILL